MDLKQQVAGALAERVRDGEVIGLGSGSTVEAAIGAIGEKVAERGIRVLGVPSSQRIAEVADKAGIIVLSPLSQVEIVWAFDGADEVDPEFQMIKGRGAAMLNEKIIARRAGGLLVIVAEEKLVSNLGQVHAVPVEVIPEASSLVIEGLKDLGASEVKVRPSSEKYGPIISEHGNLVLDARFSDIKPELESEINSLTGVVENGLFFGLCNELLIAKSDGVYQQKLGAKASLL